MSANSLRSFRGSSNIQMPQIAGSAAMGRAFFEARHADDVGDFLAIVRKREQQALEKKRSVVAKIEIGVFIAWFGGADAAAVCPFLGSDNFCFTQSDVVFLATASQPFDHSVADGNKANGRRRCRVIDRRNDEIIGAFDVGMFKIRQAGQARASMQVQPKALQPFERLRFHALAARSFPMGIVRN